MATTKKDPSTKEAKEKKPKATAKAEKKPAAKKPAKKDVKPVGTDSDVVVESAEIAAAEAVKSGSFIPALGRRKTSIARVRLIKNGKGLVTVNGRKMEAYFTAYEHREDVMSPLKAVGQAEAVDVSARVTGGGIRGQAQAIRLGISRALIILNPTFRAALKKQGFLSRDPRKRERKKFGRKGARRSPQWSKR
ncbi:30S ribosomal protein S9 [Candidatus Uhrbacteria bacterium]|nr:30S ribosomal protein S9 [Candidatus Uhrbacteria bacterium]